MISDTGTLTPVTGVLLLCTANICRSAMAEPLLAARLAALGAPVPVHSAGIAAHGAPPAAEAAAALAARGHDISGHRSRTVAAADLAAADLVLGMTREHVRLAVVLAPGAWPRTFTLKELVRRGRRIGPRRPGEPLASWLARAGHGRDHQELLGSSAEDDVPDPYGGPARDYEATADLLDQLTGDLAGLCWGLSPDG
jgi:protein-tyrosine phosphatase